MTKRKWPLVTVGMPVYNGERYLRRACDSLLLQDYRNIELVISDNDSTDDTGGICIEYAGRDDRVRYFRNPENIGAFGNFLRVLELARGDYFMWAACDDFWMPQFIGRMVEQLELNKESAVAMSAVQRLRDNKTPYDIVRFPGKRNPSKMSYFNLAMALASGKPYHLYIYGLYRTNFLRSSISRFPKVVAGDRLFVCQIALATRFSYVDEILHLRNVDSMPIIKRHEDEAMANEYRNLFSTEKTLASLGPYLCRSKIIPVSRKMYVPLLVLRYAMIDYSLPYRLVKFVILLILKVMENYTPIKIDSFQRKFRKWE